MELLILNKNLDVISIMDDYESLIWTERYYAHGDFEIYESMQSRILGYIQQDFYIQNPTSEHVMIIEQIQITTDLEDGNHMIITGRSLESLLNRRIIWKKKVLNGNLQDSIEILLNENLINPADSSRKIPNFIFKRSTNPRITDLKINAQYTGDDLYDVVQTICESNSIGFKITLNDKNQFVFELYSGENRSYDQLDNPYVVFSPTFDNIINSNYIESTKKLKNIALIGGEGDGDNRKYAVVGKSQNGMDRRELFVDARDISSYVGNGTTITNDEYILQLQQRGVKKLIENSTTKLFEGKIDATNLFIYGKDFFKGDIVQIVNEYGIGSKVRITEVVSSEDKNGISVYPTFKTVK